MKGYYLGLKIVKYIFIYLNCKVSVNIKCSNLLLIPYSTVFLFIFLLIYLFILLYNIVLVLPYIDLKFLVQKKKCMNTVRYWTNNFL